VERGGCLGAGVDVCSWWVGWTIGWDDGIGGGAL